MPLGDPEEIDAILTSYKVGLEEGERQTVEKIVEWLRKQDEPNERWSLQNSHYYADAIERGDHKERQENGNDRQ